MSGQNSKRLFGLEISNVEPSAYVTKLSLRNAKQQPLHRKGSNQIVFSKDLSSTQIPQEAHVLKQQPLMILGLGLQGELEYFGENMAYMLEAQKSQDLITDYFQDQPDLSRPMREILIDWMVELHSKYRMFPNTLFIAVSLVDKYLQRVQIERSLLQLVGTAALFLAAKYEETYQVPQLIELVKLTACTYTQDQILLMEGDILRVLNFNLLFQTPFKFLEPLATLVDHMDKKNYNLCRYILQLSLYDTIGWRFYPSMIACSTIYLINKIRKRDLAWRIQLVELTGYQQSQLKPCAKELCFLLESAKTFRNGTNIRKKFSKEEFCEVTRIRIQRRNRQK